MNVDDYTQTRITGQHQRWPVDEDSIQRMSNLKYTHSQVQESRSVPVWVYALLIAGGASILIFGFMWWLSEAN